MIKKEFRNTFLMYAITQLIYTCVLLLNCENSFSYITFTSVSVGMFIGYLIKYKKVLPKIIKIHSYIFTVFQISFLLSVYILNDQRGLNFALSILLIIYLYYINIYLVKSSNCKKR